MFLHDRRRAQRHIYWLFNPFAGVSFWPLVCTTGGNVLLPTSMVKSCCSESALQRLNWFTSRLTTIKFPGLYWNIITHLRCSQENEGSSSCPGQHDVLVLFLFDLKSVAANTVVLQMSVVKWPSALTSVNSFLISFGLSHSFLVILKKTWSPFPEVWWFWLSQKTITQRPVGNLTVLMSTFNRITCCNDQLLLHLLNQTSVHLTRSGCLQDAIWLVNGSARGFEWK